MPRQPAVPNVEWLIIHQQADELAIGDVDHRLAGLRVPVSGLDVRQWPQVVDRIQVRARHAAGLAFVQVAAQTDVAVGQGKDRLRLRQHIQVQRVLAYSPGLDRKRGMTDHTRSSSSARSPTTMSAPRSRSASR